VKEAEEEEEVKDAEEEGKDEEDEEEEGKDEEDKEDEENLPTEDDAKETIVSTGAPTSNVNLSFPSTTMPPEVTEITKKPDYDSVPFPPHDPVEPKVLSTTMNEDGVVTEVCLLPKLYVGRVLGKGGETKRDLENRSNTIINIDQTELGDKQKIIFAGTRADVDLAKHVYALMTCESGGTSNLPLGKADKRELQIPQDKVGLIIGPKGDMIRHLTQVTRSKIYVDPNTGATSPTVLTTRVSLL
jgi:hypothetical protein